MWMWMWMWQWKEGAGRWVSLNHRKADEKHKSLQVVDVAVEIMTMMKSARSGFPLAFPIQTSTAIHPHTQPRYKRIYQMK